MEEGTAQRIASALERIVVLLEIATEPRSPKKQTEIEPKSKLPTGTPVWEAYASAYEKRWGIAPPRNAQNNTMIKRVMEKVGSEEALGVAAFYLRSNDTLYVRAKHPLALLVRDAEKLYTEYKTGRTSTQAEAQRMDQRMTNFNAAADYLKETK